MTTSGNSRMKPEGIGSSSPYLLYLLHIKTITMLKVETRGGAGEGKEQKEGGERGSE